MAGTFFGINIARSGLSAQQRAMDVLGYNIANANDPTYKRQRVVHTENQVLAQSQEASSLTSSAFGNGVSSGDVERVRDALIEHRMSVASQSASNWALKSSITSQIESILGEPSDSGLQNDLDNLWDSWQEVATSPDSLALRSSLVQNAVALCERIQDIVGQLRYIKNDLNLQVQDKTQRINTIGQEIANLNNQISSMESGSMPINDLQNRRDALVQELSKLVNINQNGDGKDSYMVSIGGTMLVQGTKFTPLQTSIDPATGQTTVVWSDTGDPVNVNNGELAAAIELRDQTVPGFLSQMDDIAVALVEYVNSVHSEGYDLQGNKGVPFFTPNDPVGSVSAANITVNQDIVDNPLLIAASSEAPINGNPVVGNGDNALKLSDLKSLAVSQFPPEPSSDVYKTFSTPMTINQMYRQLVSNVGTEALVASRQATAQQLSYDQYNQQALAISGVSLDEEMTNMIKFQQAYNASSRVLSVMDEMLTALIGIGN